MIFCPALMASVQTVLDDTTTFYAMFTSEACLFVLSFNLFGYVVVVYETSKLRKYCLL